VTQSPVGVIPENLHTNIASNILEERVGGWPLGKLTSEVDFAWLV